MEALQQVSSKRRSDRVFPTEIDEVYGPIAFNGDSRVPGRLADVSDLGITTYFTDAGDRGLTASEPFFRHC